MAVHGTFLLISLLLAISYSFEAPSSLFDKNALPDITALEELRSQAESVLEGQAVELIGQSKSESERIRPQGDWWEVLFKQFCVVYKRPYIDDVQEYNLRKSFFLRSLKRHAALNAQEKHFESKARYGINKFSDWSEEEFRGLFSNVRARNGTKFGTEFVNANQVNDNGCTYYMQDPPKAIDWRKNGKVTSVKNQLKCGGCWAFVAAEQVETYWAISGKHLTDLSVQEFISCSPSLGCNGGNTCEALEWLKVASFDKTRYNLVPDSQYPYEDKETKCKYGQTSRTGATISGVCGCVSMVGKEDIMLKVMAQRGPLGVNVNSIQWHDYISGIIQRHCSDQTMNHAVQIVGYDLSGPVPYWIIRNTWGKDFGEEGYLRVKYGYNLCGVAEQPSFVFI